MLNNVLNITKKLISIPSITPEDLGCQKFLISRLKKCGFFIEEFNFKDTKNFLASKGTGRSFLFLGHTDVVSPGDIKKWNTDPFVPQVIENVLYGRGSSDMKGAISAMLIATERFLKKNPYHLGRFLWLITSDEEGNGTNGIRKVIKILEKRKEKINFCLVGEPTNEMLLGDCIKNGRRGSLSGKINVEGIQGHIAYPTLSKNPIHMSLKFLNEITKYVWDYGNDFFLPTQFQIYNIFTNNFSNNIIPSFLQIEFNFRFSPLQTVQSLQNIVNFLLKKNNLQYTIQWKLHAKPFFSSSKFLINTLSKSIYQIMKIKPRITTTGGTSDGRFLTKISDEIIEFGLKNTTIHQVNECVHVVDLKNLSQIYENFLSLIFL
ncbi:Succinyl-diaminopimelate desuccinylase [Buchnera aphidicola (Tuberolachnus salignus)]|uniref:Succinyl-diaminopimelate desuccinylase n=1 Tax=Buchnera aphidicola subsp. Tuberolachnus salignus TaxID=98804 RepID=A0A160SYP0_BUCTT|nr:succinyl-diaminopimelate desuccinylase [Buchnera aphidicola]CUR53046.1 Succinyl-diaminopimelate desuccinylase [Buchnera aphidicola (Tuberolachnus salignus)]